MSDSNVHVLIVDDEDHIREVVQYALEREGFRVTAIGDGSGVLESVRSHEPDIVVLDIMLPGVDGLEVCRRVRAESAVPILFLSARGDELDRVLGLELGGDDYLTKPFSPRELVARVRAILRRVGGSPPPSGEEPFRHGDFEVDIERHQCTAAGRTVPLTQSELAVLAALLERPGIVLSRGQLVERLYSTGHHITDRTIDSHVKRVRAKFRAVQANDPIATVHGVGYKISPG